MDLYWLVDAMTKTRSERAKALERWADDVEASDLKVADTGALRRIAELVERRDQVDEELTEAVRMARRSKHSWSEIGAMLGMSKQAAQRKDAKATTSDSQPVDRDATTSGTRAGRCALRSRRNS